MPDIHVDGGLREIEIPDGNVSQHGKLITVFTDLIFVKRTVPGDGAPFPLVIVREEVNDTELVEENGAGIRKQIPKGSDIPRRAVVADILERGVRGLGVDAVR